MTNDSLSIAIYILIAVTILLSVFVIRLEMRIRRMLRGNKIEDIEESLMSIIKDIETLDGSRKITENEIEKIKKELKKRIKTAETIRFNPFSDVGGKQSFATALLDEEGSGVVISSLYSREKTSVFGKPVKNYGSEYELTEEEKEAIQKIHG
jgi:hypothetical protein